MRAVRRTERGIEVVEVDEPAGDGVVVHVRSAGICGTDLHLAELGPLPYTLGHEIAGLLDDGSPVAVEPLHPCGTCPPCRRGQPNVCEQSMARFHGIGLDGGLAERILVDPACLVPLPAGVELGSAALVEPLGVVVRALDRLDGRDVRTLLVVGGGSIGLLAAAAARQRGWQVDLAARHPQQREVAAALGAGTEPGQRYDAVVDAAGTQSALDLALDRVRRGGAVVEVAVFWEPVVLGTALLEREVDLLPSMLYAHHHGRRELELAAELLAARPDLPGLVVTHRFPLADSAEAFRVAGQRASGAIKVQLVP